ncbi:hypothetical protein Btru_005554 [Bulinus truncatus]|nr:hypothetical protein Btru_005554 [Bulinus truncatus]
MEMFTYVHNYGVNVTIQVNLFIRVSGITLDSDYGDCIQTFQTVRYAIHVVIIPVLRMIGFAGNFLDMLVLHCNEFHNETNRTILASAANLPLTLNQCFSRAQCIIQQLNFPAVLMVGSLVHINVSLPYEITVVVYVCHMTTISLERGSVARARSLVSNVESDGSSEEESAIFENLVIPVPPSVPPKTPEPVILEPPYIPPPCQFVEVSFGEFKVLVNINCRKANFVDYLKKKSYFETDSLDMCDLQGRVAGIQHLRDNQFVNKVFEPGQIYIPCEIFTRIGGILTEIRPCVDNWEIYHPELAAILISSIRESQKGLNLPLETLQISKTKEIRKHF